MRTIKKVDESTRRSNKHMNSLYGSKGGLGVTQLKEDHRCEPSPGITAEKIERFKIISFILNHGGCRESVKWNVAIENKNKEILHARLWDKAVEEINGPYRFDYVESFSHASIRFADQLLIDHSREFVLVSDPIADLIHKFNMDGDYCGQIFAGSPCADIHGVTGLFKDNDHLYVSDVAKRQIVRFSLEGKIEETYDLKKITNNAYADVLPFFGCMDDNRVYLSCTGPSMARHQIISFRKQNPVGSFQELNTEKMNYPEHVIAYRGEIYVTDGKSNIVYKFNLQQKVFDIYIRINMPGSLRRCVFHENDVYMNVGNSIIKMNQDGFVIFFVDLSKISGLHDIGVNNIAISSDGENTILFASDYKQNCIHKFFI